MRKNRHPLAYRIIKGLVRFFYPKTEVIGTENLPEEPVMIVGNHAQMHGPIACELYFPGNRYTWCAGQMMHLKEVPEYAYQDFWSCKPRYIRWFYKLLSYIIAPFSVLIFNNANTIPVYKDARIISTFKTTLNKLVDGSSVIIFPEHEIPFNHILCDFQDKFIDIAKLYRKKANRELEFLPMYIAPDLKKIYLGKPIRFCASNPIDQERERICGYLKDEITRIAVSLPKHTVVPYRNIPKKYYPSNIPKEVTVHESTGG